MQKASVKKNYIYNVMYQIMALLTPLITTPYISRVLGAEGIGIYSFTGNVNAYFTFFAALGTAKFGIREIAYVSNDRKKRSEVFWNVEILSCICVIISLIVYGFFCAFQQDKIIYMILALNIISVALEISWLYQGVENFGKIAIRNCIIKLLYVLYVFVFVKEKNDLILYILGLPLLTFISNISLWFSLRKYVDFVSIKNLNPFKYLKGTIALFIPTMAIQIYSALDVIMIKWLSNSYVENGYYEQALKLSKMALTLVSAFSVVMLPRIASLYKSEKSEELKDNMYKSFKFIFLLGFPLCFGLIGISDNIVPWYYGEGYEKLTILLKILALLVLIMGLSGVTGSQYLVSIKKQKEYTVSIIIGLIINVVLNYIFIPKYFSIGAAIASVISELVILIIQFIFIKKDLSILNILKSQAVYLFSSIIMLVVIRILNVYLTPSFINTCIMIIIGMIIYCMSLFLLKDEFYLSIWHGIISKFAVKLKKERN